MNRLFKFVFIFFASAIISCFSSQLLLFPANAQLVSQVSSSRNSPSPASNELLNGVILAVVSGIVGFLANFAIERLKEKNQPKKQISYSKIIKSGIVGNIEKDIEDKIRILYNGRPTQNIFYVFFDIENTGNQQVKNQEIRFEFTNKSEILDVFHEPQRIEPEMELNELPEPSLGKHEKKFMIGTLKPKEKLGFRFIVQGSQNEPLVLEHHTKNDDDVNFIKVEDKRTVDDIEQIRSFLWNWLVAFVLFPLMQKVFPYFLSELISPLLSLGSLVIFSFFILPNLDSFIKSVVNLVKKKQSDIQKSEKVGLLVMGGSVNVENFSVSSDPKKV